MTKTWALLLTLAVAVLCNAQKTNSEVDKYVKKEMRELGIPGMAVAVIRDGKVLHQQTYGIANIEYKLPVTSGTTFQIASVSKLFTSTLVIKWMQEGKINLEDSINKYIMVAPQRWSGIRVKHLLSHEGGIRWPSTLGGYLGTAAVTSVRVEPLDTLVNNLKDSTLTFEPGSRQAYQNGDYFVLQYILEKIGGKPIEQLFRDELFHPLGMENSGYDVEVRSHPYQTMLPVTNKSQNFTKGKNGPLIFKGFYSPASYCAGGLFLSIADAVKWIKTLDQGKFITEAMQEQISRRTEVKGGFTQLGWTIENNNGHEMIGHSGGPGLADVIRFPEEKLTVIVLSNYADMYPYMAQAIAKLYIKDITLPAIPKVFDRGLAR
ncbi:beta-lactamase family protein [Nostoc ellipsosporum NOK]|nr:beta-lactamase family protein [Nostoc ellipsosporum NOK]